MEASITSAKEADWARKGEGLGVNRIKLAFPLYQQTDWGRNERGPTIPTVASPKGVTDEIVTYVGKRHPFIFFGSLNLSVISS